jgi:hypothetical protein
VGPAPAEKFHQEGSRMIAELIHYTPLILAAAVLVAAAGVAGYVIYLQWKVGREIDQDRSGDDWDQVKKDLVKLHHLHGKN